MTATHTTLSNQLDAARANVEALLAKENVLRQEYAAIPARMTEAEQADLRVDSQRHAAWVQGGSKGYRHPPNRTHVQAVEARLAELPRRVSEAMLRRLRAEEKLEQLLKKEAHDAGESDREVVSRIDQEVEQLMAERHEVQARIDRAEGTARRHEIAMYEKFNEANRIETELGL